MTARDDFHKADSFAVYYGKGCIEKMKAYDIAVVEPEAQDFMSIVELKKSGTVVLAYISVVEATQQQADSILTREDLLCSGSETLMNAEFHTYYADLRRERWLKHLTQKAEMCLAEYGCDGLFLDTIGDLEDYRIPVNTRYELIGQAVEWIGAVRRDLNNPILVQNNGLGLLLHYTKEYIDGVCWENTGIRKGAAGKFDRVVLKKLRAAREENGVKILLLTEESKKSDKIRKLAVRNHFLYYDAPGDYIRMA